MNEKNSRRSFLRQGFGIAALAGFSVSPSHAFSLQNPGRDSGDKRYVGDATKRFVMVLDLLSFLPLSPPDHCTVS